MMFSRTCGYGLRAMLYLAVHAPDETRRVPIRSVAGALDISYPFLAKIVLSLTQAGLIDATRGVGGGIRLGRKPEEISPLDIILVLDGPGIFKRCVLGLDGCDDETPCPLHRKWSAIRPEMERLFADTNLRTFAREIRKNGLRLENLGAPE